MHDLVFLIKFSFQYLYRPSVISQGIMAVEVGMDLFMVVEHVVVLIMEEAVVMLGGVGDMAWQIVPPS